MRYQKLISELSKYGEITENERKNIRDFFSIINVKKRDILICKDSPCNKLFFVNKGLLRTFYIDINGNEITRRIAWENGFLTNMNSFRKNGIDNNETIECLENAELLVITKSDIDYLLKSSENLTRIYNIILEKYMAINIRRYEHVTSLNPTERLNYFNNNFPNIKNRISDTILATYLSISRKTLERIKKNLINK